MKMTKHINDLMVFGTTNKDEILSETTNKNYIILLNMNIKNPPDGQSKDKKYKHSKFLTEETYNKVLEYTRIKYIKSYAKFHIEMA